MRRCIYNEALSGGWRGKVRGATACGVTFQPKSDSLGPENGRSMLNNIYVSKGYINNLNKMLLRPKKAVSLYKNPARNRFEDQSLEIIGVLL